jgi:hypothetical protein
VDADHRFIRETVPAFSARTVFDNLRKRPEYASLSYKEATLNPSNPQDLADGFEASLVQRFRQDPEVKEISGFRRLGTDSVFYSARPLSVSKQSCLACHSDPASAPPSMVAVYGAKNGFGWKLHDTVSAQIVYVPAGNVLAGAQRSLVLVMAIFIGVFALAVAASNRLLSGLVVRPLGLMARLATKLGREGFRADDAEMVALGRVAARGDELGAAAGVFQTMAREVMERERALTERVQALQIQIDEAKRDRAVSEVVKSEFFQDIKSKARDIRQRRTRDVTADE